jgi:hypothetical protein
MKENEIKVKSKNWGHDSDSSAEVSDRKEKNPKKIPSVASSVSEYTEKEIKYLDKYLAEVENAIDVI